MNNNGFTKIMIVFGAIFLLSRLKHIIAYLAGIFNEDMLSLDPIRDFPDGARAAITVAFYGLVFVVIWKLVLKK